MEKVNVQEESTVQNEPSIIVVGCVDVLCSYSSREVHFKLCCRVSEGFALIPSQSAEESCSRLCFVFHADWFNTMRQHFAWSHFSHLKKDFLGVYILHLSQ